MTDFDIFCNTLLEESKLFLEKAKKSKTKEEESCYLHASLMLCSSALEAFINGISDDFADSKKFSLLEKAMMLEKEIEFTKGKFNLTDKLKIFRLNDRVEFLYCKFKKTHIDKDNSKWWANLQNGLNLRNKLIHPKENVTVTIKLIELTIQATIDCIDELFKIIYKKGLPSLSMGLESKLNF